MLHSLIITPSETRVGVGGGDLCVTDLSFSPSGRQVFFGLISKRAFLFNSGFPVVHPASCVVVNAPEKISFFSQIGENTPQVFVQLSYCGTTASYGVTNFSKIPVLFSSVGDNGACGNVTFSSGNHKNKHFQYNSYINQPKTAKLWQTL